MRRSRSRTPCKQAAYPHDADGYGQHNFPISYDDCEDLTIPHSDKYERDDMEIPQGLLAKEAGSTLDFEAISTSVAHQDWVQKAASIFKQYRVVILNDLFSHRVTDLVLKALQDLHQNWSAVYDPDGAVGNRLPGRYELMGAFDVWHLTHLPGYLEALEEFAQKGGLRLIEALGSYKFVGGHAHLCLTGTQNWQPLHSDFVHPGPREMSPLWKDPAHVPFMDLMFTLHPLTSTNAALRVIPGVPTIEETYQQFGWNGTPPPKSKKEHDIFRRAGLYPLPAGCGVLRDIRIWHGGTPNTSGEDRYTAVLRFYSTWSLDLWKDKVYEGKGVDQQEMQEKLGHEAQQIVSRHIVRSENDPKPQMVDFEGWPLKYDGWKHRYD